MPHPIDTTTTESGSFPSEAGMASPCGETTGKTVASQEEAVAPTFTESSRNLRLIEPTTDGRQASSTSPRPVNGSGVLPAAPPSPSSKVPRIQSKLFDILQAGPQDAQANSESVTIKRVGSSNRFGNTAVKPSDAKENVMPRPGMPQRTRPELSRIGSKQKSIVIPKCSGLETAFIAREKLDKAIEIAKTWYCSENLELLRVIFKWEEASTPEARSVLQHIMQSEFIEEDSPKEVCLPPNLRTRYLGPSLGESDISSLKRFILNDTRFNDKILEALEENN